MTGGHQTPQKAPNTAGPSNAAKPPVHPFGAAVSGRDREFLPAAIEILETPPSPASVAFMFTLFALITSALVWSVVGKLDVHAVAQGKIKRGDSVKVVQPLEPGKIASIHVLSGDRVKAGAVIAELDRTEALSDLAVSSDNRQAGLAEIARRRAAIDVAGKARWALASGKVTDSTSIALSILKDVAENPNEKVIWDEEPSQQVRSRQLSVLSADLFLLLDVLTAIDRQIAEKEATRNRLTLSIRDQEKLLETLQLRVKTREEALALNVGTKINIYDAQEDLQKSQVTLTSDRGQLNEIEAALRQLLSEKHYRNLLPITKTSYLT